MLRRILTVLTAAASASAVTVTMPTAANAGAYGCRGSLVGTWPVPMKDALNGGTYYRSDIKLYYNPSSGWNCAVLVKRPGKPRYGEKTPMFVEMYNGRWAEDKWRNNHDRDNGSFRYQAGPVKVYGKNMCVDILAMHGDHTGSDTDYNGRRSVVRAGCR
ncbi:hypothetical protein ABT294_42410 [Nonomuraea sp. NPDC000554]|uniref:hypothetical protein n=1 Tax=Nonomuraea sp. NPDC000554 TaxID=3154259 RepID=UPI00332C2F36